MNRSFPHSSDGKESACNAGDQGEGVGVRSLGRSSGKGNGNPLQYSCLENSMERGTWWATVHRVTVRYNWSEELMLLNCGVAEDF